MCCGLVGFFPLLSQCIHVAYPTIFSMCFIQYRSFQQLLISIVVILKKKKKKKRAGTTTQPKQTLSLLAFNFFAKKKIAMCTRKIAQSDLCLRKKKKLLKKKKIPQS